MASRAEQMDPRDETAGEESADFITDDESTGQKCCPKKEKERVLQVELNVEKIISKNKSDSMFELRRLTHQERPVSAFSSKDLLESCLAKHPSSSVDASPNVSSSIDAVGPSPNASSSVDASPNAITSEGPAAAPVITQGAMATADTAGEEETDNDDASITRRVQQFASSSHTEPLSSRELRPELVQQEMERLLERRMVQHILQGPVQEEIDRALREGLEQRRARERGRRRPPPRPSPQVEDSNRDGGDEEAEPPIGRLMSRTSRRQRGRGSGGRRVRFRPQLPTPNPDGRYSVPHRRDQSVIVDRLRQSPALNSLGDETRDEVVAEVSSLVSQHLVTSALTGDFRGVLELHIQSRADQMNGGGGRQNRPEYRYQQQQEPQSSDEERREPVASAQVRELREEMVMMKGQMNELKQMMRLSFELQLDIQRSIRQEVAAALTAFLSQPTVTSSSGSPASGLPHSCPVPTLGHSPQEQGLGFASASGSSGGSSGRIRVVESGHCVICSEGTIDSVIYHCGHMCTCTACGLELKSKALKCPICRAPITDVIRAYASML